MHVLAALEGLVVAGFEASEGVAVLSTCPTSWLARDFSGYTRTVSGTTKIPAIPSPATFLAVSGATPEATTL